MNNKITIDSVPLISIIVPVYNAERYLHKCINSILKQVFANFELLLINDGSLDQSGSICDDFAKEDSRIRVFHKKNGGVSSARNLGLENVRTKYLCFVDADDEVGSTYLSNLLHGDVDIVISGLSFISLSNELTHNIPCKFQAYRKEDIGGCIFNLEELILLNGPCQKRFTTNIIKKHKLSFDHNISSGEDTLFVLSYLQFVSSIIVINRSDYFYRRESNTLSVKRMHYELTYKYANEMYSLRKSMNRRFCVDKKVKYYTELIYQTYLFSSIYTLYYTHVPKKDRLNFLKNIYKKRNARVMLRNSSFKNVFSSILYNIASPVFSDACYSLFFKFLK